MPPQDPEAISSPQLADQVGDFFIHDDLSYTEPLHEFVFSMVNIASLRTVRLVMPLHQKTVSF